MSSKDVLMNEVETETTAESKEQELPNPASIVVNASLPRFYPRWKGKPIYDGNKEALGWALDAIGRSVSFIGAGAFLGTALLRLAKEAAGCETDPPPGSNRVPDCNNRVYGIRPSSLLTTYTVVVGVVSASLMPFMGAIVDYTEHRRRVARCTSFAICVLLFPQIFLNEHTWLAVAILQMAVAFTGWAQTMVTYAYLPELTESQEKLNKYTQSYTVVSFGAMILYLVGVVAIAYIAGFSDDDIATARLGQGVSFGVSCVFLYAAWGHLFERRPPARTLPQGHSLYTAGFIQVYRTSIHIYKNLQALKWFYISVSFVDAAINSIATIMITYLTDTLGFSSQENGIAILILLIGSIPGGILAGKTNVIINPIRGSIVATIIMTANTIVAAIVLKGPGQEIDTYIMAFIWGIGTGWKWTTDRLLASSIIPTGQDAELMGIYLFAGQVLTWLPPLAFTALNEAGISQRVGIGSLAVFFIIGIISLALMGDYKAAVDFAGRLDVPTPIDSTPGETSDDEGVRLDDETGVEHDPLANR